MGIGDVSVVTGAFSFTGRYITARLLAQGTEVRALTRHPDRRHPFGDRVPASLLDFRQPKELVAGLRGATTLFNTYWIRYEYGRVTFDGAVKNTRILAEAAREAGVRKIVHISATNSFLDSTTPFCRGKAHQERAIIDSGVPYAILRPTLIYGKEDILVNNIAWFIRTFPFFTVPGSGDYRVQPIYVDDVAEAAVGMAMRSDLPIEDIGGPEIFTFNDLIRTMGETIGLKVRIVHIPPSLAYVSTRTVGLALNDIILTRDEIQALMGGLLVTNHPARGKTVFSDWIAKHAATLGRKYTSGRRRYFSGLSKGLSS